MPDLDAKGLEAAAKALSHDEGIALWDEWTPAAQSDLLTAAEAAIRAYLTAAGRAAAPDDDDGPFREDLPAILQSVRDGQGTGHYEHPVVPLHIALAAVTRAEAAGRAAATPDPRSDSAYTCSGCDTIHVPVAAASPDERLREALAFYADKGNYTAQNPVGSGAHVWRDMGQRARAALAADRDSLAEKPETDT